MPELNAAGLALIVLVTLVAVWLFRRKTITPREVARAGVLAAGYFLVMGVLSVHLCDAGNPVRQVLLPSLCLMLILTTIERPMAKWLGIGVAVVGAVLTYQAVELVHDGYPTNPRYAERQGRIVLMRIAAEMRGRTGPGAATKPTAAKPTEIAEPRPVPAELLLGALGEQHLTPAGEVLMPVLRRRWFTNLTGMYQVEREPMRVMSRGDEAAIDPLDALELAPSTQPAMSAG